MVSDPVLHLPDVARPFTINTDYSEWALGCELQQEDVVSGRLYPVAYDGRKLTPAEINYPVHEKELLAIKHALTLWNRYVDNGH